MSISAQGRCRSGHHDREAQNRVRRAHKEVAALKGQNVDALAQKNALQEKVTNLSKELEAALNRNKDLDQQFEATRKELEEAKGHLRNLLEAGNGQDSQIKHWQDIAKKHADKVEQLELEISTCKATLKRRSQR